MPVASARNSLVAACAAGSLLCAAASPFDVTAVVERTAAGTTSVAVVFSIQPGTHLYADTTEIVPSPGTSFLQTAMPKPVRKLDGSSGDERDMFEESFTARYAVVGLTTSTFGVTVRFQGCDASTCFLPEEHVFSLGAAAAVAAPLPAAAPPVQDWQALARQFIVTATDAGYMNVRAFTALLDRGEAGEAATEDPHLAQLRSKGAVMTIVAVLIGGLLLNLTPCVLPLMPVTLAIIGAGAHARSRLRALIVGLAYGAGMALAYGTLGATVVLTGTRFGALNGTPWFNGAVALVFVVLALAMFDVFFIDFTRFTPTAMGTPRGSLAAVFVMGIVAALLAGACVAPVVLGVLVLSADLYARGMIAGLLLPFVLGAGMALPWPLAAAGISFLPKPGAWMVWLKRAMGVVILVFAAWYGWEGVRIARGVADTGASDTLWRTSLPEALAEARSRALPVFIDFRASWCKNCLAMEATTLRDPAVRARLGRFVAVKFSAEHPNASPAKDVLDYFDVVGLPTYVVLQPQGHDETKNP